MMLTRKQQFRRQVLKKTNQTRYDHNYIYAEGTSRYNESITPVRASSLPTVGTANSLTQNGRTWQTTGDLHTNSTSNQKMIKDKSCRINFNNAVRVVLIPTREEYRAAGLSDVMWWDDSDYKNFKDSALTELRNLVQKRGSKLDTKTALMILYQPNQNASIDELQDVTSVIDLNSAQVVESHSIINGLDSCKKQSVVILRKNSHDDASIGLKSDGEKFKSKERITNGKNIENEKILSSSWSTSTVDSLLVSR